MTRPDDAAPSPSPSPTGASALGRRELLRYAAGALALGLGTPLRALAEDGHDGEEWQAVVKFSFYEPDSSTPVHWFTASRRLAELLVQPGTQLMGKVTAVSKVVAVGKQDAGETLALYQVTQIQRPG